MKEILVKLQEAGILSADDQTAILAAYDAKLEEAKKEAEIRVRGELSERYNHDKQELINAADKVLSETVLKYEQQAQAEAQKYTENTNRLRESVTKIRRENQEKLAEQASVIDAFVQDALTKEISDFQEDRNQVNQLKVKLATQIAESKEVHKKAIAEHIQQLTDFATKQLDEAISSFAKREQEIIAERKEEESKVQANMQAINEAAIDQIAKFDKFIVGKLASELMEFKTDKDALVEARVKFIAESKEQMAKAEQTFIANAAKLIDRKVTESLNHELTILKDDLMESKKNMFGMKIFETFADVFKVSHFSETKEIKELRSILESKEKELNTTKQALQETAKQAEYANRKAALIENKSLRESTLNELLSTLSGTKRRVMAEMLAPVKTENLKESFTKYISAVSGTDESTKKPAKLNEASEFKKEEKQIVTITGDQKPNRLDESIQEPEIDTELLRLAGIKTK